VYNAESQGEVFATQILTAESKLAGATAKLKSLKTSGAPQDTLAQIAANIAGYKGQINTLTERTKDFNAGQSQVLVLERREKDMSNKLGVENVHLNQLITAYNSDISALNLIEAGAVPLIKSRPKRSLIVISAVLVTAIFSFIGVLLLILCEPHDDFHAKHTYQPKRLKEWFFHFQDAQKFVLIAQALRTLIK